MPSRIQIIVVSRDAVQAQLKESRNNSMPWPDTPLGPHDGGGYNFSNRTLRPFVKKIYRRIKGDPTMGPASERFDLPDRLPITKLLGGNVTHLETWVAGNISGQLGL